MTFTNLKIEHIFLIVIVAFLLYHLVSRCGCTNRVVNGFRVGGQYIESASCVIGLSNTCSNNVSSTCLECVDDNQELLKKADCSPADVSSWCESFFPGQIKLDLSVYYTTDNGTDNGTDNETINASFNNRIYIPFFNYYTCNIFNKEVLKSKSLIGMKSKSEECEKKNEKNEGYMLQLYNTQDQVNKNNISIGYEGRINNAINIELTDYNEEYRAYRFSIKENIKTYDSLLDKSTNFEDFLNKLFIDNTIFDSMYVVYNGPKQNKITQFNISISK